jgi:ATP-dependent Clp protease ATP-binding subunit ClpB
MFEPLTRSQIEQVVDIQLQAVQQLLHASNIELNVTPVARKWIAEVGYDPLYGARPVKRTIQRELINELSKRILAGDIHREHPIVVDVRDHQLSFQN